MEAVAEVVEGCGRGIHCRMRGGRESGIFAGGSFVLGGNGETGASGASQVTFGARSAGSRSSQELTY